MQRIKMVRPNDLLKDCGYSAGDIVICIKEENGVYYVLNKHYNSNPWIQEIGYCLSEGYFVLLDTLQEETSCI